MKKVIMATLCCIGFATSQAQVTVKPGVRAGLNISSLTNYNADSRADFYVGGQVGIQFTKFYTLQPELTYSRQGATGMIIFLMILLIQLFLQDQGEENMTSNCNIFL